MVADAYDGTVKGSSTTRLYASSIAVVSGLYSILSALGEAIGAPMTGGTAMTTGEFIMLGIGVVVLVHGIVLLTPASARLGQASGPLMMLWAVIMLGNQLVFGDVPGSDMPGMSGMAWDGGMAAVAVLMLISGLIMSVRPSESGM